ncbi:MAG: chromosomal replication initiator protein DnaA [Propionibacteriaceae bacterium]|nr:chromosomal replication initiator protein DnaA [Propionibacteriaceae bacterium]
MDATPAETNSEAAAQAAWDYVLSQSGPIAAKWLRTAKPLALSDAYLIVATASDFAKQRLEDRLRADVEDALSDFCVKPMTLVVSVQPGLELNLGREISDDDANTDTLDEPPQPPALAPRDNTDSRPPIQNHFNPRYTFDNFVIGPSNRFAHAAAEAVAESPGTAYNPLLIYGPSGLGKTHLLHAIGHYLEEYYPTLRVRYVSTEEMTNAFINAVADRKMAQFRADFRDLDVLLLDDIQFLENKDQTQEEFFHTFNTLHNASKQIVMTCDRPPKALELLEIRLRSRFEWGLITDMQPADLETRTAILRRKAAAEHLQVPQDVLELIAERIQTNIRELEGALLKVTAYATLNRTTPDREMAETLLADIVPDPDLNRITPATIIDETAKYFGVAPEAIVGTSRTQQLVAARQIAMYLTRDMTDLSWPKIGQEFGGRDHTTAMHAYRKIKELMRERRSTYTQVVEVMERVKKAQS